MMRFVLPVFALLLSPLIFLPAASAEDAPPKPSDFAYGINLGIEAKRPLQELLLPDSVYAGVTDATLADLRVFNAAGQVVPHALCLDPRPVPERVEQRALPVFPVQQGLTAVQALGTHVAVQTQGGTQVEVTEPTQGSATPPTPIVQSYIIDVRGVTDPLRDIALGWSATNGASELAVSVEASDYDELDHWQTIVERSTLLHVEADGQTLQRAQLPLPENLYSYLRITSLDGEGLLQLRGVTADVVVRREHLPPRWFSASPAGPGKDDDTTLYDSSHRAPLDSAQIATPDNNMSLRVALDSRDDDRDPWTTRWVGEVYAVGEGGSRRVSPAVHFGATSDRMWRLHVIRGAETLGGRPLALQLGYTPGRLRFLTQGAAPYLLAYGSGRVQGTPQDCDSLLTGFDAKDLAGLTGVAHDEPAHLLSGASVLATPAKPTPKRLIVLWAVLVIGVLLLAGMAFSLLKKVRQE